MDSEGLYIVANSIEFQLITSRIFQKNIPHVPIRFFGGSNELIDLLSAPETEQLPSVIILVMNNPGADVIQILARLKNPVDLNTEYLRRIPVIILTGEKYNLEVADCYRAGANAVLSKPEDKEKLTKTFESICDFWININKGPEFRRQSLF
ncbi:hypothetical protein [Dyadobacter sp. CY312]|uniref:hypothetical protein n=1 Tax=Dyadobacter sp. CY312 TaxID=2907303 RepID=UPI001F180652|nr:hypothetical protein [Dyadobacter sp. CY312]MCE7038746.1 hypothetical protein [Dyadobacter sp. CY312]